MNNQLNTLLTTLYVDLEDRIMPEIGYTRSHQPGRKPLLSDAELLCLVVAQQLMQFNSETRWIRHARAHLREMFPNVPTQSGYNKRVRAAGVLIAAVITELARDTPSWHEDLRLLDSTPVPCGKSRETAKRSDLAGHTSYGYCASHSRYFWGFRLYLISAPDGMPIIWGLANPKIGEREVTEALIRHDHRLVRPGQTILADKGFAGKEFESFISEEAAATLIRPDRKGEAKRFGKLGGTRQWIESVFDTVKGQLTLEEHAGRTIAGVYARVGSRLLALAAGIWHNWRL
ncbi:IS982 family transposase, partial [Arthrobacter rhombi]